MCSWNSWCLLNGVVLCPDPVSVYKPEPSVCDDPLHTECVLRIHAACGHTPQRHCLLLWLPQSVRHGESLLLCNNSHHEAMITHLVPPHRLKQELWWTLLASAASLWLLTAGVAWCLVWTHFHHGPTPQHLCRCTNSCFSISSFHESPLLLAFEPQKTWRKCRILWLLAMNLLLSLSCRTSKEGGLQIILRPLRNRTRMCEQNMWRHSVHHRIYACSVIFYLKKHKQWFIVWHYCLK